MDFNRWWANDPTERYWLEITDRKDLGVNLRVPQLGRDGRAKWQYDLIHEVRPGDIVFHYSQLPGDEAGICAWSRAVGEVWSEPITWAPHAGGHAGETKRSPGWRISLEGYYPLDGGAITLESIRQLNDEIRSIEARLREQYGQSTYVPFEVGKRPIHPSPAYLTKMPRDIVMLFPGTAAVSGFDFDRTEAFSAEAHRTFRRTNEQVLVSERDPFAVDPTLVERGLRAHAQTQNELADYLDWHGVRPLSPTPGEPQYDLAFEVGDVLTVVEVKCMTRDSSEHQLRLGLGQVLRYAQLMGLDRDIVRPALALDRQPPDDWLELAASLEVLVGWPGHWARLL